MPLQKLLYRRLRKTLGISTWTEKQPKTATCAAVQHGPIAKVALDTQHQPLIRRKGKYEKSRQLPVLKRSALNSAELEAQSKDKAIRG
jgi:hypothetical protein